MLYSSHTNSLFSSVSYRLGRALIDPGDVWKGFDCISSVLLTHAHFDHIYGLNNLVERNPKVLVYTNLIGAEMLVDAKLNMSYYHETPYIFNHPEKIRIVENNEEIYLDAGLTVRAVITPGHNGSCITWLFDDLIFTGDSYIPGIKIISTLPGGNKQQAKESLELIMNLATGRRICPGHKTSISSKL